MNGSGGTGSPHLSIMRKRRLKKTESGEMKAELHALFTSPQASANTARCVQVQRRASERMFAFEAVHNDKSALASSEGRLIRQRSAAGDKHASD